MTGTLATYYAGKRISSFNYNIMEFEHMGVQITTLDDDLVYVGETTEKIFIFNKSIAKTIVYPTNEINNLKFYNFDAIGDLEYWKLLKEEYEKSQNEKNLPKG